MKFLLLLCITLFFYKLSYSQNEKCHCVIETYYFPNNKIEISYEIDTLNFKYCGLYKEFDSTGILLMEGTYTNVDSIACEDCYVYNSWDFNLNRNALKKDSFVYFYSLRTGVWKFYYPNGKLKEEGTYSDKVHSYTSTGLYDPDQFKSFLNKTNSYLTISGGPIGVGLDIEYLKDGVWTYYDERGKILKKEYLINGLLVHEEIAN
jgi:antitoxin component YwqK of YwqJK toxin-antitoxin module